MTNVAETADGAAPAVDQKLVLFAAVACGAIVANLYYAQPLVDLIARDLALAPSAASGVVSLTQIGYGVGLILLAPLVDLTETRRLLTLTLGAAALALAATALAPSGAAFFAASFAIGVASTAAQMLLPIVANAAPAETRGQTVGTVMSGLLLGILLARPVASVLADVAGWRAVFGISAGLMVVIAVTLRAYVPSRAPQGGMSYGAFLGSMLTLLKRHRVLRRRAAYQAAMFAVFSLFWTAVPMRLSETYGWSHSWIGLFALAGAAGALVAPWAGRLADAGLTRPGTLAALVIAAIGFAVAGLDGWGGVAALLFGAVVVDVGVQINMLLGQRAIYGLDETARGRLNGLYVAMLFLGGAAGSALVSPLMTTWGWPAVAIAGALIPLAALAFAAFDDGRD
ncbi:putative MFS family arabinose efflux permease [Methylopila capsulata]|uniref:MFS family arabinose efflux permease n=1 Tax=Methylopila capsulata TaxID=61654 RepID=A0A9W6MQW8_9HYPH|nr:MFS transporter [Methylopila capsulata]MBM7851359.1 putative MFS family arabinose efflux permease [Methylopila capsulata]GLK54416.1 MFS transporter [Methylopila capsulata]